uniref:Uncharacterized protein n=2 Tax=Oryza TaxID=4527 RepID=A0A0D3HG41_9ORYZ
MDAWLSAAGDEEMRCRVAPAAAGCSRQKDELQARKMDSNVEREHGHYQQQESKFVSMVIGPWIALKCPRHNYATATFAMAFPGAKTKETALWISVNTVDDGSLYTSV